MVYITHKAPIIGKLGVYHRKADESTSPPCFLPEMDAPVAFPP
jgi:hypothetical protein